jgi:hypothetical protein
VIVEQKPGHPAVGLAAAVIVGNGFTVTITVFVLLHPPEDPVTVYIVVIVGDTVMRLPVDDPGIQV